MCGIKMEIWFFLLHIIPFVTFLAKKIQTSANTPRHNAFSYIFTAKRHAAPEILIGNDKNQLFRP